MTGAALPRVLLVGAGVMGGHHGRVIAESARCDLAAVVDPDEHRGRGLARRYGAAWAPEIDTLSGVDAVVVASPTGQHRRTALDVLGENIPLFVEKPLSASLAESQEIVDAALGRGTPLMCGFIERFNPAVRQVMSRVNAPEAVFTYRFSGYSTRMNAGVSWDLLVHDVDLVLGIFDGQKPIVEGATTGRHSGEERIGEDTATALVKFADTNAAVLSASRVADYRARIMTISQPGAIIVADLLNPTVTVYAPSSSPPGLRCTDPPAFPVLEHVDCSERRGPLTAQWDHFVDIIEGKSDPRAEAASILPSHEAVEAILDAATERYVDI
ncbi:Gfo/Idh/MocA family oxidoreductase [Streptomyces sp. NBC_00631]|uniref:Gfo/Idh/MocA family protein n=1 Tax=Streptomyces sp. NBC_00631 TaxID=2975793 RepID=UPI0030E0D914